MLPKRRYVVADDLHVGPQDPGADPDNIELLVWVSFNVEKSWVAHSFCSVSADTQG